MNKKYYLIIGIVLFFLTVLLINFLPSYLGYCRDKGRFLSEKEKIEIAINYIIANQQDNDRIFSIREDGALNGRGGVIKKSLGKSIHYKNITDFMAVNPNCCTLVKDISNIGEGVSNPLLEKLAGQFNTYVKVRYKIHYKNIANHIKTDYIVLSNCSVNTKYQRHIMYVEEYE